MWVIPSEVTSALNTLSKAFTESLPASRATVSDGREHERSIAGSEAVAEAERAAAEAKAAAEDSELGPRQIEARRTGLGADGVPNPDPAHAVRPDERP
jgi:hypothetical protein